MRTRKPYKIAQDGIDRVKLVEIREAKKLSSSEVARHLGFSRSRYHHYESGRRSILLPMARSLCSILGCTLDQIAKQDEKILQESLPSH